MTEHQIAQQYVPAGWYPDHTGYLRWWDGYQWGNYAPPPAPVQQVQVQHPRYANNMPVSYVRPQTGHSLTKHILLGWLLLYIPTMYYAASPNHYFHS